MAEEKPYRLESQLVAKILEMYRKRGAFLEKTHGNEFTRSGMPDLVGCYRGHYIALEAKRKGNKATPLQEQVLKEIRAAQGIAIVVWSVHEALNVLDAIDEAEGIG